MIDSYTTTTTNNNNNNNDNNKIITLILINHALANRTECQDWETGKNYYVGSQWSEPGRCSISHCKSHKKGVLVKVIGFV